MYPRRFELGPPDGHGDGTLWAAHGQRQPPHLAIDAKLPLPPQTPNKYSKTSSFHAVTENSGLKRGTEQQRICYCCVVNI